MITIRWLEGPGASEGLAVLEGLELQNKASVIKCSQSKLVSQTRTSKTK